MSKLSSLNLNTLIWKLKANVNWLLLFALLILLAVEGLAIQKSVQTVLRFQGQAEEEIRTGGVRINFANYDQVVKYKDEAAVFRAREEDIHNPFGVR